MVKKLVSGLILVHLAQISAPPPKKKFFFRGYLFHLVLDIIVSYLCMQFQGKLMKQNLRKWQKTWLLLNNGWHPSRQSDITISQKGLHLQNSSLHQLMRLNAPLAWWNLFALGQDISLVKKTWVFVCAFVNIKNSQNVTFKR